MAAFALVGALAGGALTTAAAVPVAHAVHAAPAQADADLAAVVDAASSGRHLVSPRRDGGGSGDAASDKHRDDRGDEHRADPAVPVRPRHPVRSYAALARRWNALGLFERAPSGTRWQSIRVDGARRRYLLSEPAHVRAAPLVIGFHGLGERSALFARQSGLVAATRRAGEVLVLPESSGPAFNDGRLGARGPHDDAFALDVVRRLVRSGAVDRHRVTVTGFSNGAGMAMQLAETHPGAVAAVVSIDGDMIDAADAARPTSPVRAVLVHGTADPVQPWRGRPSQGLTWPSYISIPATVHVWARADLTANSVRTVVRRRCDDGRDHRVDVTQYRAAPHGAPVSFYAVVGMGHRWPVDRRSDARTRNDQVEAVSATELITRTAHRALARAPRLAQTGTSTT